MATLDTGKLSTWSKRIILASCIFYIALDVYWATNTPHGDTISEVTLAFGHKFLFVPAAFGVLTGHLFWPYRTPIKWKWQKMGVMWMIGVLVGISDYLHLIQVTPIIPAVVFIPIGHFLWPQTTASSTELLLPKG